MPCTCAAGMSWLLLMHCHWLAFGHAVVHGKLLLGAVLQWTELEAQSRNDVRLRLVGGPKPSSSNGSRKRATLCPSCLLDYSLRSSHSGVSTLQGICLLLWRLPFFAFELIGNRPPNMLCRDTAAVAANCNPTTLAATGLPGMLVADVGCTMHYI